MELLTTENGKYRIEYLSAATFPGAMQVIRESFCQGESVCIGSEVNKNPAAVEEVLVMCVDTALDGVSLVAVEIDSGEVAAALFNKIQVPYSNSPENNFFETFAAEHCTQPETRALVEFIADFDTRINYFERYDVDCTFEIMILGSLQKHKRNGLATLLCKESVEIAKKLKEGLMKELNIMTVEDLGPKYAFMPPRKPIAKIPKIVFSLWTTPGSQKIRQKLNFQVDLRVSFKEFSYNGMTYEERIGAEIYCEAASIRID